MNPAGKNCRISISQHSEMKKILSFSFTSLLLSGIQAQKNINIKVSDSLTLFPIENALLVLQGQSSYLTDAGGETIIPNAPDTGQVIITCVGYNTVQTTMESISTNPQIFLSPGDVNLEEVVVTGHSLNQTGTISKIDLKIRPVNSAQDFLRTVPGLFIAQHQGGGKAEQIFIRGFDNDHGTDIAVSSDGIPVNLVSHAHGQGYNDMHFIIPETVGTIDYGAGPYYTSVGNLNTSGYVKVNTLNAIARNIIKVEAGMFNTYRTVGMFNMLSKKAAGKGQHWYTASEFLYSDGPFDLPQAFKRKNIFSKFNTRLGSSNQLTLSAGWFESNWYASGQIPERAVDAGIISRWGVIDKEKGTTGRWNLNAILQTRLGASAYWSNQIYFSRYNFNLFSNFTFFLVDTVNGDQINQFEKRNMIGYNSVLHTDQQLGKWQGRTEAGIGVRHDAADNSQLSNTKDFSIIKERLSWGDIRETNYYAFAGQTFSNNHWQVNIGARFDGFNFQYLDKLQNNLKQTESKAIISPKLNVQYTRNNRTQFFLKAGSGFHSNDTRVVVAQKGREILPAAYGADMGVIFKPAPGVVINAAIWYLYLQQEFVYVGDAAEVEPSGRTVRKGIDISARVQLSNAWYAYSNINYAHGRSIDDEKGNNLIPLAPTWSSMGGIVYKGKGPVNGSLVYRYLKDRPANSDNSLTAEGYFVNDLTVNFTQKKYEIGIVVENVFNTKWREAQFETVTRLKMETIPVNAVCFTPGVPLNARLRLSVFF